MTIIDNAQLQNPAIQAGTASNISIYDADIFSSSINDPIISLRNDTIITVEDKSFSGAELMEAIELFRIIKEAEPQYSV